ncbi:hypothetical protein L2E82_03224 [Cichorium intybus]|uniref:Uncharacterized protein n=1 Tax=Cichorium intybus TaxID=13427 RepID=A0ACB9H5P1_CICIN|nr:hypothetical protein L2E82_03224 [Cichorium intybus]
MALTPLNSQAGRPVSTRCRKNLAKPSTPPMSIVSTVVVEMEAVEEEREADVSVVDEVAEVEKINLFASN